MTPPVINLRTASPAEINAAVAERLGGWKWRKNLGTAAGYQSVSPMSEAGQTLYGAPHECFADAPDYVNDSNAVIALLQKGEWNCSNYADGSVCIEVDKSGTIEAHQGFSKTFNLAAIAALLRANGVEVAE